MLATTGALRGYLGFKLMTRVNIALRAGIASNSTTPDFGEIFLKAKEIENSHKLGDGKKVSELCEDLYRIEKKVLLAEQKDPLTKTIFNLAYGEDEEPSPVKKDEIAVLKFIARSEDQELFAKFGPLKQAQLFMTSLVANPENCADKIASCFLQHLDSQSLSVVERLSKKIALKFVEIKDETLEKSFPKSSFNSFLLSSQASSPNAAEILLRAGINPDKVDEELGLSAIYISLIKEDLASVKTLLAGGASVNCEHDPRNNLLLMSLLGGVKDKAVVEYFAKNVAAINVFGSDGLAPVHLIPKREEAIRLMEILQSRGADINALAQNPAIIEGFNALHVTASLPKDCFWRDDLARFLIAQKEIDFNLARKSDGTTPFTLAVMNGNYKIADTLLERGVNIDEPNPQNGITPLFLFTLYNCLNEVKYLCDRGASLASVTKQDARFNNGPLVEAGSTMLEVAKKLGYEELANYLTTIKKSPRIEVVDESDLPSSDVESPSAGNLPKPGKSL